MTSGSGSISEARRHHGDVVDGGEGEDFAQLADSTHLGRARLNEVHRYHIEHVLEFHYRGDVLATRDGNSGGTPQLREAVEILRRPQRLFEKLQVDGLEFCGEVLRFGLPFRINP